MATKKKGKAAKKAGKKTTAKAPGKKREKKEKKPKVPYVTNPERLVYFMNSLIQAGYVGKSIPADSKEKRKASMELRQMAQQLDRQVHKSTT